MGRWLKLRGGGQAEVVGLESVGHGMGGGRLGRGMWITIFGSIALPPPDPPDNLLAALDRHGFRNSTIVVFMGDHGCGEGGEAGEMVSE